MRSKLIFLSLVLIACVAIVQAQTASKQILRRGNKAYSKQDYAQAEEHYRALQRQDSTSAYANFAIGSALYQQGKDEEAKQSLERALQSPTLAQEKQAQVLHNLGNISMRKKDYAQAIDYYQKSLILNPEDDDTRYNLVLAQKLQKKDQQQQNQQQQNDKQNEQNNKDQQQNQQNQDKNKQDNQDKQKPQEKDQKEDKGKQNPDAQNPTEPQQKDGQLSREQAEQILDAYKQNDDKTRRRVEQEQRELKQERNNKVRRKW